MRAQVAADLRAAADVLERDGWTQGRYHSADGCHCLVGALRATANVDYYSREKREWRSIFDHAGLRRVADAYTTFAFHIGRRPTENQVIGWNDYSMRTAAEVIAALRAAADAAEADQ